MDLAIVSLSWKELWELSQIIAKYDYRILVGSNPEIQLSAMPTPNPNTIKFLPNKTFFEAGSVDFPTKEEAEENANSAEIAIQQKFDEKRKEEAKKINKSLPRGIK